MSLVFILLFYLSDSLSFSNCFIHVKVEVDLKSLSQAYPNTGCNVRIQLVCDASPVHHRTPNTHQIYVHQQLQGTYLSQFNYQHFWEV